MKNSNDIIPNDLTHIGMSELSETENQLLNIYWCKKELDEFLPQIATYASTKELTAITLSQLSIIEKQIVKILHNMAQKENS